MIAEVIVDIANSEVDRIFDYTCEHPDVVAGSRVIVNFGGREIEGYVINLKEKSDYDSEKLKPVIKALENYPVISAEMLDLMRYMTYKYHLRIVDVLRLFIPSEMRQGKVRELSIKLASVNPEYSGGKYVDFLRKNSSAAIELLKFLDVNGAQSVTELNKNFSAAALRNLIIKGIINIETVSVNRRPYSKILEQDAECFTLNQSQVKALEKLRAAKGTALLHGVTGSGKTEVYLRYINEAIVSGKTAIMLVPEISLTPQMLSVFRSRFGQSVAIMHSRLSAGERFDEWRRILNGEASVVVGARSAIFAPVKNLGVIIIDEEHDGSYFSESNPRYSTLEVAEFRRVYNNCVLALGSATPSVETYYKAISGEYKLIELPDRINKRFPDISICNMKNEVKAGVSGPFSRPLLEALKENLKSGNQAMLFLNRRGYASFVMCQSCGYVAKCEDCDVSLVYHREDEELKCHYCSNRYKALDICPECGENLRMGYMGTERIAAELKKLFPQARILRMDNETTRGKDSHYNILEKFRKKEADILVGTQMIAKGHDFPDVTLVGILDADMSLHFSDYRATERTFQLITQVSGRAGRNEKDGKVILQTYMPEHYVYKFSVNNNYIGFFDKECNTREVTKYPPFSKIVRVLLSGEDESLAAECLKTIYNEIKEYFDARLSEKVYLGAMRAPLKRIERKYRFQILLRLVGENIEKNIQTVYNIIDKNTKKGLSVFVEQNPQNLS